MSVKGVEDSPSIQQILAEGSIFELIKGLSEGIFGTNRTICGKNTNRIRRVEKKPHFQVYEALLRGRTNENDDTDLEFRLVSCVTRLNLPDNDFKRLSQHLQLLSRCPHGEGVLRFLLGLANSAPQPPSTQTRNHKGVFFFCPPEMLDGSLFEQWPSQRQVDEDYQSTMARFDASPGSQLPLTQKFFKCYGVAVEEPRRVSTPVSVQEAPAPPPPEVDWGEVAAMGPPPRCRTWESLGHLEPWGEKPLASEAAGRGVGGQRLRRDLAFLLAGVASSSFPFSQGLQRFEVAEGLEVEGLSSAVLATLVSPLLECGRLHRQLEEFCGGAAQGTVAKALRQTVSRFLVLHGEASQGLLAAGGSSLLRLARGVSWLAPPLAAVAAVCAEDPRGTTALEQLCRRAAVLPPGRTACVLFSLLKNAAEAYFRLLGRWLFEGEVDEEGSAEFLVQLQPGTLGLRSRRFWTHGFVLLEGRVPSFLAGLEDAVLMCGKAVRFLRLCNPEDPLVCELRSERPPLQCCLQPRELAGLRDRCLGYEVRVREVCGPVVSAASQLERSREQQAAFLEMVQRVQRGRVAEIRASQQADRAAVQAGKRLLLSEWQRQVEEGRQRRAEGLRRERDEEGRRQREADQQQASRDLRLAREREKVVSHYEALSQAADDRRALSERRIERLRRQLETNDVNSNPLEAPDDNANPPSPARIVPTSLPLLPDHHLGDVNANQETGDAGISDQEPAPTTEDFSTRSAEAARNKARVLQHEFNLITNYNDIAPNEIQDAVSQPTVTEIYNLGNSEAARNKARILQHEFNNDKVSNKEVNIMNLDLPHDNTDMKISLTEIYESGHREAARNRARVLQQEWSHPRRASKVSESSNTPGSPCSDLPCSNMSVSVESPSVTADSPGGGFTSAMSISFETPSSAMTSSADSKDTPTSEVPPRVPKSVSNLSFISALSVLSEPLKWSLNKDKDNINCSVKKLDLSAGHLSHLLRETVAVVLTTQVKLVNQSVLKLFLQDEQLFGHFRSLRQYFLLVDGEFARQTTERLCRGMEENAGNPRSLLNFVSLDGILRQSLSSSVHGSKDPHADRLSLGVRFEPSCFEPRDVEALTCVQLQYRVSWPLCLLVTPEALLQYDRLCCFLLGLRRGVWATDEAFQWLQRPPQVDHKRLATSAHYHQLRLFRHEMGSFVQALHSYFMNFAVLECWKNCKKFLKKATTLDELYKAHTYFVKQVIFYCLLRKEAVSAQKLLQSVLRSVLKFGGQMTARDWVLKDGVYEHPSFDQLAATFAQFKMRTSVLLRHMAKIAKRGYQPVLNELLHLLNMNEYYNIKI